MNKLESALNWLDSRTGYRKIINGALFEPVPGGARWRYIWGSTLKFTFLVQVVTGLFLWMAYSANTNGAWESVFYIQHQMFGGWLVRGIHHFTAQAMTVLLVLHLLQVVIDGAYKAPREVNYWFGVILLVLVLALSFTGYLLPWDQKGYWASKVAMSIVSVVPFVGPALQKMLVGGPEFGHLTLTRFFALHAGVLPLLVMLFTVAHIYLFRKHGVKAKEPLRKPTANFWPDQLLMDVVACLAVMAAVLFLVLKPRLFGTGMGGADLGPPADPSEPFSAARPEWYFLFLFQFLKSKWLTGVFGEHGEFFGAILLPGLGLLVLCAMPFIGRWRLGHRFNVGFLFAVLFGAVMLTFLALFEDRSKPEYIASVKQAEHESRRIVEAAKVRGIPPEGGVVLKHSDPLLEGPKLFAKNCATCHRYGGFDGLGNIVNDPPSAPDLKDFASREWLATFLHPDHITSSNMFGNTRFTSGKMVKFVKKDVAAFNPEQKEQLRKAIAALSAEAALPAQRVKDATETALIAEGRGIITNAVLRCNECHQFRIPDERASAPDLTGYGSREWLMAIIGNPKHNRFYGRRNDRMPAFAEEKVLTPEQIGLIADWLRGDTELKIAER
jgi:ubiquinol-cytochrome c reductase cytochrome b subunit